LSVAILYEYPDTDEEGIKITAQDLGIDLKYIPFRKVSILIGNDVFGFKSRNADFRPLIDGVNSVLNRTQSKNRRLYAASILEGFGKYVLNPLNIESTCFSKFRTLVEFWRRGIPIPKTIYIPCDSHDQTLRGMQIHNEEVIADLIQKDLGNGNIVVKPDAGTHGREVRLAKDRESLVKFVEGTEPSIINPVGFVAQEFVEKWFYDLRIIVAKERGTPPYCFPVALARAGFKDFRTNTYLGNMVFGAKLPVEAQSMAVKAGEAVGGESEAWVLALDAMLNVGEDRFVDDEYIMSELEKLVPSFEKVKEVKADQEGKNRDFRGWSHRLEAAYNAYKDVEAYGKVSEVIEESIERGKNRVLFHEANSCPEFWEQTRLIAGVNVAEPLLKCAKSVEGWSVYQKIKLNH
jgi:glutathione synthase/RimK-type ligase-like ATP-grasp enzyme